MSHLRPLVPRGKSSQPSQSLQVMDSKVLTFLPTLSFPRREKYLRSTGTRIKKLEKNSHLQGVQHALIRRNRISITLGFHSDDSRAEGNLTSLGSSLHNNWEEERKCDVCMRQVMKRKSCPTHQK